MAGIPRWSGEIEDMLMSLYWEGVSYSDIASRMRITRSAVAGKIKRMKLPRRIPDTAWISKPSAAPEPKPRTKIGGRFIKSGGSLPLPTVATQDGSLHACDIFALRESSCRWPIDASLWPQQCWGIVYCGSEVEREGSPYCATHAARAYHNHNRRMPPPR